MKSVNGLIKCIFICLVSVFMFAADDIAHEKVCDEYVSVDSDVETFLSTRDMKCRIPRNYNYAYSLRASFRTLRQGNGNAPGAGLAMIRTAKSVDEYSTVLFRKSIARFPSGMNESNNRLISLGKLII